MIVGSVAGIDIITDSRLVRQEGVKIVKKTWRDRITWKFWEKYKVIPNIVPIEKFFFHDGKVVCHPAMFDELKEMIVR